MAPLQSYPDRRPFLRILFSNESTCLSAPRAHIKPRPAGSSRIVFASAECLCRVGKQTPARLHSLLQSPKHGSSRAVSPVCAARFPNRPICGRTCLTHSLDDTNISTANRPHAKKRPTRLPTPHPSALAADHSLTAEISLTAVHAEPCNFPEKHCSSSLLSSADALNLRQKTRQLHMPYQGKNRNAAPCHRGSGEQFLRRSPEQSASCQTGPCESAEAALYRGHNNARSRVPFTRRPGGSFEIFGHRVGTLEIASNS